MSKTLYSDSLNKVQDYLKLKGLKWTRQRDVVLRSFVAAEHHITVDELANLARETYPALGTATVYRTMRLLVDANVALEHRFGDGQGRYEVAVSRDHHDHLICENCGLIIEFDDDRIEALQVENAQAHGFLPKNHRLEIYGLCADCRKKAPAS